MFAPGLRSGDGTSTGGCDVASGGESFAWATVPGAEAGIHGVGARVPGTEVRFHEAGAKTVLLSTECCHLAGEILYPQRKCGDAVRGWTNAR
jgi:hypothetical protein